MTSYTSSIINYFSLWIPAYAGMTKKTAAVTSFPHRRESILLNVIFGKWYYRLFIPLFICFGLTSLYTSEDDIEARGVHAVKTTVINKDFTIRFDRNEIFISSTAELTDELRQNIIRQLAIGLKASQRPKAYGTFRTPPTVESVGVGAGAETTDPHECCLLWCIPMCVRNCFKKICCG